MCVQKNHVNIRTQRGGISSTTKLHTLRQSKKSCWNLAAYTSNRTGAKTNAHALIWFFWI